MVYIVKETLNFLKELKIHKKIFLTELVFIAVLFLTSFAWTNILEYRQDILFENDINAQSQEALSGLITDFQIYMLYFLGVTLIAAVIFLAGWGITRTIIWGTMLKKKFPKKTWKKVVTMKILWQLVWLPLIILFMIPIFMFSSIVQTNPDLVGFYSTIIYANLLLYIFIAYLGFFMYRYFFEHFKKYDAITQGIKAGLKNIPKFIYPTLLVIILFLLYFYISLIINILIINILLLTYVVHVSEKYFMKSILKL